MSLTRESILGMSLPKEIVAVPEWGGHVTIRSMGIAERLEYERWAKTLGPDSKDHIVGLLAFTMVDDAGDRLFRLEDMKELEKQSASVISRLNEVALRLNKITEAEVTVAKGES